MLQRVVAYIICESVWTVSFFHFPFHSIANYIVLILFFANSVSYFLHYLFLNSVIWIYSIVYGYLTVPAPLFLPFCNC